MFYCCNHWAVPGGSLPSWPRRRPRWDLSPQIHRESWCTSPRALSWPLGGWGRPPVCTSNSSFIEEQPAPRSSPKPHEAECDSEKLLAQGNHLLTIAAARTQILTTDGHCPHPPPQSPRLLRVTPWREPVPNTSVHMQTPGPPESRSGCRDPRLTAPRLWTDSLSWGPRFEKIWVSGREPPDSQGGWASPKSGGPWTGGQVTPPASLRDPKGRRSRSL